MHEFLVSWFDSNHLMYPFFRLTGLHGCLQEYKLRTNVPPLLLWSALIHLTLIEFLVSWFDSNHLMLPLFFVWPATWLFTRIQNFVRTYPHFSGLIRTYSSGSHLNSLSIQSISGLRCRIHARKSLVKFEALLTYRLFRGIYYIPSFHFDGLLWPDLGTPLHLGVWFALPCH